MVRRQATGMRGSWYIWVRHVRLWKMPWTPEAAFQLREANKHLKRERSEAVCIFRELCHGTAQATHQGAQSRSTLYRQWERQSVHLSLWATTATSNSSVWPSQTYFPSTLLSSTTPRGKTVRREQWEMKVSPHFSPFRHERPKPYHSSFPSPLTLPVSSSHCSILCLHKINFSLQSSREHAVFVSLCWLTLFSLRHMKFL